MEVRFLTIALTLHALTGAHQWPDQSQEQNPCRGCDQPSRFSRMLSCSLAKPLGPRQSRVSCAAEAACSQPNPRLEKLPCASVTRGCQNLTPNRAPAVSQPLSTAMRAT